MNKTKSSWKDGIQTFGRSLLLPIALLAPIGMVMGICSAMTQSYMIAKFPFLGNEVVKLIFSSLQTITNIVFNNIPLLFAMGVAQGMAKKEKGIAVFAATVGYLTLNVVMSVYLKATGTLADADVAARVGQGTVLGIQTLKIEAMGGLIAGLVAAKVADKFYRVELPLAFAFFGGKKSIPIITFACMIPIGLIVPIIWNALTSFLISISFIFTTPYIGSAIYYALNRALIPFGLHHVLASLVRFTEAGGTYMINGQEFVGILNATNEILFNLGPDSEYWSQLMPTLTSYLGGGIPLNIVFLWIRFYPVFADHIPVPEHFHILWKRSNLCRNFHFYLLPQSCHILWITFTGFVDDPGNRACIHGDTDGFVNALSSEITFFITCKYGLFSPCFQLFFSKEMSRYSVAQRDQDHVCNPDSNQVGGHPVIPVISTAIFPYPFSYKKGDE